MNDERVGMSGLTEREAREFMKSYEKGMWTFVAIASLAHIAVWAWKPCYDFMYHQATTLLCVNRLITQSLSH